MNISMVVCTYNRIKMLKEAINSLLCQSIINDPSIKWEVIVVNNNSDDGTEEYLKELAKENRFVKYVLETNQGIGYARNAALENAQYDIIAYIDDDETADENWAAEMIRVFKENDNIGCVSGPYYLEEKEKIPTWFPKEMHGILGDINNYSEQKDYFDLGRKDCYAGNMAISKKVVEHGLRFPLLGRKKDILLNGEDIYMAFSIYDAGFKVFYAPKAKIYHKFIPARATVNYAIKSFKGLAYSNAKKNKFFYYFFCLFLRTLIFPFRVLLDYRKRLYHFVRIFYEYYRLKASMQMIFGDNNIGCNKLQ